VKVAEIARALGCSVDPRWEQFDISRIASPQDADGHCLVFLSNPKYLDAVAACKAQVIIAPRGNLFPSKCVLEMADPYLGFARAGQLLEDTSPLFDAESGSGRTYIHPTAKVHSSVIIGPYSVVGKECVIGENTVIGPLCVIENGTVIGTNCKIDSGVIVRRHCVIGNRVIIQSGTVIGSEGFGNARDGARWFRIPHFGNVIIEDDAEIGANTTIDRGALGPTVIGARVKIDNLVMIAHNVTVGEDSAIAAQTGISGSTMVGKRGILAGQTGFVGHIEIGDDAFVGAKAGVSKNVEKGAKVTGYPARDLMKMRRIEAAQTQLPDLLKEIKSLRKRIEELEKAVNKKGE
jgi:UDP-3-O-[3-hydroxymyristoyl] glucosamine N-acyltransferase